MAAISMTNEEFQKAMTQEKPILVDFWAPWCGYCRRIAPAYDKVAEQYGNDITVVKVNIDEEPLLANAEHIEIIPTLILYRGGKSLGSIVAPESKAMIDTFIRETLEK